MLTSAHHPRSSAWCRTRWPDHLLNRSPCSSLYWDENGPKTWPSHKQDKKQQQHKTHPQKWQYRTRCNFLRTVLFVKLWTLQYRTRCKFSRTVLFVTRQTLQKQTMVEIYLSAGLDGVFQLECVRLKVVDALQYIHNIKNGPKTWTSQKQLRWSHSHQLIVNIISCDNDKSGHLIFLRALM